MGNNHVKVSQGFRILLSGLAPYIARELSNEYGSDWWADGVMDILYDEQKRNLPYTGEWGELVDSLDIARALLLFDIHWHRIFRKKLSLDYRTWAKELIGVRNKLAHLGVTIFPMMIHASPRYNGPIMRPNRFRWGRRNTELVKKVCHGTENGSTTITQSPSSPSNTKGRKLKVY